MVIKPEAIPQFSGDLGAVEAHATSLNTAGNDFRLTGQDVHSTWQGLSAFYEAPEAATLFSATVTVRNDADAFGDDVQEVGAALTQYVQVMRPIVARLASLKSEAGTFVADIGGDDDWRADEGKVNQNNDLIRQVDTQLAAMMAAERQAANRINRLFGGTQWVAGDGSDNPNAYGFDASKLPAEAERPWGTSEERDLPWYQDGWNFVTGEYVGFFADGLWGDLTGLAGLINPFDWDTFSASWGGLWTLTGGVFFDPAKTGNAWKEFGKSLLAWDTWSEDPGRAFGLVLYNVVTIPLAPVKVGAIGKGGKAAGALADGGKAADAAKAAEAARLTAAGKVLDDFGDVADVGKVDSLPTVGDLAKQIDLHLGDVLKANPDLQRALQDADALARVDAPSRVEAPDVPARVEEPALVGAGRNGGTDLAPPRTGGGADLPPPRVGDGDGGELPPPRTGDGVELPGGPGRGGEPGLPDNPGRTGDSNPFDPGRTVDDPRGPDRDAQDTPDNPADDPPGRPENPADDKPGAPDRPEDQPNGDKPNGDKPGDIRADLDNTGRGADDAADAGSGAADDTADAGSGATDDAGRGADDAGGAADDAAGPGRTADDAPAVERYDKSDLQLDQSRYSRIYKEDMYLGSDGKYHFEGDPVGTQRNKAGQLMNEDGTAYVKDDNPRETEKIGKRAQPGIEHDLSPEDRPQPTGDPVVDEAREAARRDAETAVDQARDARRKVAAHLEQLRENLEPIAEKLDEHDIKLDEKALSPENFEATLAKADKYLTDEELEILRRDGELWASEMGALREASEQLGEAGGGRYVAERYPDATPLTGGEGVRGTPGTLDRVVFDEETGKLVIIEEKGAGSTLGSRIVVDPETGKPVRAEQMSPEYLRDMLESDPRLAEALREDPDLLDDVDKAIRNGDLEYVLVRTHEDGSVSYTPYRLDDERLDPKSIRVAGS